MSEQSVDYLSLLGYTLLRNGQIERAIKILSAVHVAVPNNEWVVTILAGAHLSAQNFEACLEYLNKLPEASQNHVREQLMRCRALWGLGKHPQARKLIRSISSKLGSIHGI